MHNSNETTNLINNEFEEQYKRDRQMRAGRNKFQNKYGKLKTVQLWKKHLRNYIINDLQNYGPTNLLHIQALCNVIGKPIRISTSKGNLHETVNTDGNNGDTIRHDVINIEYHRKRHWTLLGNKDPWDVEKDLNACLFAVVAAQTGSSAGDLRIRTIDFLINNGRYLIDEIDKISSKDSASLMIGGARYNGTSPTAAGVILDRSQNVHCDGCRDVGHPRGHASDKDATGPIDSVENYSRTTGGMKSGFLNKNDQNLVAHHALNHATARRAMDSLNNGAYSEAVTLLGRELTITLPKMKEFYDGEEYTGELDIVKITLVLRHHRGMRKDPDADVFVHTIYPQSS